MRSTIMNSFCPSCNTSVPGDVRFCGHCGHFLAGPAPAQTVHSLPKSVLRQNHFTLSFVLLLLMAVILIASLILQWFNILPHIPQNCGGAFSDWFHGNLDSRWSWVNPSGNATYSTGQG